MRLTTVLVLLLFTSPAVRAQQPAASTTVTLRGVVVTSSDVPLARVRVAVGGAPPSEAPVLTDDRGQFAVRVPDTELVQLTFTKARYATALVDVRRRELSARDDTMRVRLALGGVISGQVRDRSGEPVLQVVVTGWRLGTAPPVPPVQNVTTNDLGEFRFAGLVPGAYALGMRPSPQFNPAAAAQDVPAQQTVNVGLGAEVSGVDFTIDVPADSTPRGTNTGPTAAGGTGSVRGRVLTSRGVPIAGAVVQGYGSRSGAATDSVETDARGRFVIARLSPGDYRVRAFKSGYFAPGAGERRSAIDFLSTSGSLEGRVVTVGRGQTLDPIDLILGRGASITGTIVDEFGEPMQNVSVSALELRAVGGRTRALRASSQGTTGRTDDRGQYRLFGLQPGTYVVQAVASEVLTTTDGYVTQFYPGTPIIDLATPTKLDIDQAAAGVDLRLVPGPTIRVRGTVSDPAGKSPERTTLTLTADARSGGIQTEPVRTTSNEDGTFVFNNVAPGDYVVQATSMGFPGPGANVPIANQFVAAPVTVGSADLPPLRLTLARGASLMGRVVYEGFAEPPAPYSGPTLVAVSAAFDRDPLALNGSVGFTLLSDNTFEYRGVFGSNVLVSQSLRNPDWYVKSITYRGEDLADSPFDFGFSETFRDIEVVVSARGSRVTGRATDDHAVPVRDYTVALFAADRSKWTVRSRWLKVGRSMQDGAFRLTGVVPGDYWVVAVDRLEGTEVAGDLQNPELLDALASRAQRITLGEGQSQDLTLRLVRR